MDKRENILYLIVPCYNEEEGLPHAAGIMREKFKRLLAEDKIAPESKIMLIDDGSRDGTWRIISGLCEQDETFSGLRFSRNYGHQSAILAGMMKARSWADMIVTIDSDLQQDIEALDEFIRCYQEGCEIVYGIRNDRNADGFLKKLTATGFYGFSRLLGGNVISNHADYRLLSKTALDALSQHREVNLFLRGLIPSLGFQSDVVYFDVKKREAGHSKYTFGKMMSLAADGITSMSIRPLRLITALGFVVSLCSCGLIVKCLVDWLLGNNLQGYTTILVMLLTLGGLTLFSLGIVGEYVGKIYMETKARPRYIVDAVIWKEPKKEKAEDETDRPTCR